MMEEKDKEHPKDLIEGSGVLGPSKDFNSWPNDPLGPYRGQSMSQGLMQLLPSNFLKNFTLLGNIIRECGEDSEAWFPSIMHDLMYIAGCISGEAGELVNEVKKVRRGTHTLDEQRTKIEEESIDVFIFLATLWAELGTNVTEIYNAKRARNAERFESGRVGTDRTSPAGE